MDPPVFLLAYANDQDNYLPHLKKESQLTYESLAALEDSAQVRIHREESASVDTLINAFERFDGNIVIFHYGGHAGGHHIGLEGGIGQAEGLARLIARQAKQKLKLAFLNGCSTKEQVSRLLSLGVKIVIATSVPIQDDKAVEFAYRFYRKLANHGSIQQAFGSASDGLLLKYQGIPKPELFPVNLSRDAVFQEGMETNDFPWGLYYNQEETSALDWTIPPPISSFQRPSEDVAFEVNDYIYPILDPMVDFQPKLRQDIDRLEDEREYFDLIIRSFPWNIGSQIKILVSTDPTMNTPQLSRLKQIVSTYTAATQFLFYTLLAQLTGKKTGTNPPEIQENLHRLFNLSNTDFLAFDYVTEFQDVMTKMQLSMVDPFVIEFKDLCNELGAGNELYDVCQYLQSVKEQLAAGQTEKLVTGIYSECADSEYALAYLLRCLSFIVNYQMVTVRDINIFNPWHREPLFRHHMGRLYSSADDQLRLFREPRAYSEFLENSSILLLKNLEEIGSFLSLSPFYIDRNAFGNQEASATDLHTFAYVDSRQGQDDNDYYYFKSSHSIFKVMETSMDQIHTGQVIKGNTRRTRFKGRLRNTADQKPRKPYALLEEQFAKMQGF